MFGNRTEWRTGWGSVPYTYDTASRLEQAGAATYDYDMAGNLTGQQSPTGSSHFSYTAQHRLATAQTPEAAVSYAYDAAGRRIMRTEVTSAGAAAVGPGGETPLQKDAVATGAHRSVYRYDGTSRMVSSRVEMERGGCSAIDETGEPGRRTVQACAYRRAAGGRERGKPHHVY